MYSEFYGNNCDNNQCNHENKCKHNNNDSCINGIRATLKAIIDCVHHSNIPGFGINIEITLNTGLVYRIEIHSGVFEQAKICDTVVNFGDLTISICDISKIKVLTSETSNREFIS
ncbi:hypothetical protein [Romboutsia lituseburensis]|uniref:hypothetical protein n=1 Tax=Romboutsia lituseburensis TaxID=1537 RepID=UPI00215AED4F|nr:hypothetical protein [Romboutsia lituseburensis]MCR8743979.1 hypothetical protein [Romboutsia lituseburensis]